jgi:hypothetical protein
MTDDDLEARVSELEDALRELRREVERPPRGPLGLPRPPTPGELARAADEHAIPAAIASLEATIHALELLRLGLRTGSPGRDRTSGKTSRGETAERVGRAALDRLDRALDDAVDALEGRPTDPESRELLDEARRLREEIAERVEDAAEGNANRKDETPSETEDSPQVDVDAELQSIKDQENQTGSKR